VLYDKYCAYAALLANYDKIFDSLPSISISLLKLSLSTQIFSFMLLFLFIFVYFCWFVFIWFKVLGDVNVLT